MRRDVFQAIADPTRREIIGLLAQGALTLNGVAENFAVSRPAISKHIKILTECGLVVIRQEGRERYCEASLHQLREVSQWTEQYHAFWSEKLDRLEQFLSRNTHRENLLIGSARMPTSRKEKVEKTTAKKAMVEKAMVEKVTAGKVTAEKAMAKKVKTKNAAIKKSVARERGKSRPA